MKISREIKTAVLVIAGILLFIYLFKFLQGENLFKPTNTYFTEFDYNALSTSSVVTIKGNAVGKISNIKYDFKTGKTRVAFTVDPQLKFSKNSVIRLYETGLMGGNALAVIAANDTDYAKPGDMLKSEIQPGLITSLRDNFTGLSSDLDQTIRSADTLMVNLNKLVADESEEGIKQTIAQLNSTLKSFKTLSESIDAMVNQNDQKVAMLLDNFGETSENLKQLSYDLKDLELERTVNNLDSTLVTFKNIMASIEKGEGSAGKLLNDDQLYNNLEGATLQLEKLLEDFRINPKRYVHFSIFGKKAQPYFVEEPETDEKDN
ncbi:MlaD family protein [Paucihalobacter ruber]|uniref:MlaD family protein n=1 Tax=Paucihalobacter ruber TaxID=2567861 RepID=UPI001FE4C269|nr:MlaD family protein [Paucihalobacter ruber]